MRRPTLAAAAAAVLAAGALTAALQTPARAYTALPAHVYAPYYETYLAPNTPSITATAQASGVKYYTLAFLQASGKNSCTLEWNGSSTQPLGYYNSDIASLRALGGDVIPSFGGYSADQGATDINETCTNVNTLAADYESVITTLGVTRLDFDVEAKELSNTAAIDRRSQALALVEAWAASNGIPLQVQFTLPVEQYGLDANGEYVVQSAATYGAAVNSVNVMAFDYYIAGEGTVEMGQAAENAVTNTEAQLATIYPSDTSAQLWNMMAVTLLPGIDDYPKKTEVTSVADAQTVENFAVAHNMNLLSIWAIQRDNGGCVGSTDSNTCSGIAQNTWDFSNVLNPFTG